MNGAAAIVNFAGENIGIPPLPWWRTVLLERSSPHCRRSLRLTAIALPFLGGVGAPELIILLVLIPIALLPLVFLLVAFAIDQQPYLQGYLAVDSLWLSELVYSPLVDPFTGMAFALCYPLGMPGYDLPVLPFISLVPLIFLSASSDSPASAARRAFAFGTIALASMTGNATAAGAQTVGANLLAPRGNPLLLLRRAIRFQPSQADVVGGELAPFRGRPV